MRLHTDAVGPLEDLSTEIVGPLPQIAERRVDVNADRSLQVLDGCRRVEGGDDKISTFLSSRVALGFGTLLKVFCFAALASLSASAQVLTTTTLTLTQAGTGVGLVALSTPVTLTATVAAGGAGLSPGQVTFCDAATYCTDVHALGTVQLSSAGIAKLTLLPGAAGGHSYQARFLGTVGAAASISNAVMVTVAPSTPPPATSVTALSAGGVPGSYTLTATVTGSGTAAPSGVVSFADATNSGYVLGTATLGAAAAGLSYTMGASYTTGTFVDETAVGDFNGDGFPDIVTMNGLGSGTTTVLMNKGDGTFTTLPSFAGTTGEPGSLAVGDFNGDGNVDIAIGDAVDGQVTILLGNGDGTFRRGSTTVLPPYSSNNAVGSYSIAVGDFNRDGIADLAIVDPWSQTLRVLLGKGDGTFTVQAAHPATGVNPLDIAVGDFNGDGKLDLIVCNAFGSGYSLTATTLNVFLGDGDGTFDKVSDIPTSGGAEQIFAADFDGDGRLDLAINHPGVAPGVLEVLSGNGDGTFTARAPSKSYVYLVGIGMGDLNGDGRPDFGAAFDQASNNVAGLIGNADGTFTQTQWGTDSWQLPNGAVVADFKGVGYGEIAIANQQNGVTIMEPHWTGAATATVTGISPVGTGTHYGYATYSGDANYSGSTSNQVPLAAQPVPTTTTLSASPASSTFGQQVALAAKVAPDLAQNHSATGSVTFSFGSTILGTAQLANGSATFSTSALPAGNDCLTATYAGDTNFVTSATAAGTFCYQVNPASGAGPTVTSVIPNSGPVAGGTTVTVTGTNLTGATVVSFGAVSAASFSVLSATSITAVTPAGTGTVDVTVTTPSGTSTTSVADQFTYLTSGTAPQTITFPPLSSAYAATAVPLAATSSSGLPVTYTVVSGPAILTGSILRYIAVGTVVIEADQTGNSVYAAAAPVQQTVTVSLLTEPVGSTSSVVSTQVIFTAGGTLSSISMYTQGAVNLDFLQQQNLGNSSCKIGTAYAAGQSCEILFNFTPIRPGLRYGGISLTTSAGALLANSYILGFGVGPMIDYIPGTQSLIGSGLSQPSGVAVDGNKNVFVSQLGVGLSEIVHSTGATVSIGNFGDGDDVAVDGSGNLFFITQTTLSEVLAVDGVIPASPTILTLASGFPSLDSVAVDGNGDVYMANGETFVNGSLVAGGAYEVLAVNGVIPASPTIRSLGSGFASPTGIAVDSNGNVYVSDSGNSAVYEMEAQNGTIPASPTIRSLASGFSSPSNVRLDDSTDVYVSDVGNHALYELVAVNGVIPASPVIRSLGIGIVTPQGMVVDESGNIFIADQSLTQIVKLDYADAPSLTFANTLVGATSSDSPQTVSLQNSGNAPLEFLPGNPAISSGFTLGAGSTCPTVTAATGSASLGVQAACTYVVSFTPIVAGIDNGTLVSTDNNLNVQPSTQTILLNGTGTLITPTIVFSVPNQFYGTPPFAVAASSNSPAPITYTVVSGPATISGNTVTLTGTGTVVLLASQPATGMYAAGSAMASFLVSKQSQTINFVAPPTPVIFGVPPVALQATATSGLPVVFTVLSGPATVSGNVLTYTGFGTVVVAADQAGNAYFNAAPEVTHTVVVLNGAVIISLTGTPNPVFVSDPLTLTATVSSMAGSPTGTVMFLDGSSAIGTSTVSGGTAILVTSALTLGTHVITAVYGGDATFATVTSKPLSVLVEDFSFVITNPSVTISHGGTGVFNYIVTTVGGTNTASPISFSITGNPDHSPVTFNPAGIATGSGTTSGTLTIATPDYPVGPWSSIAAPRATLTLAALGLLLLPLGQIGRKRRLLHMGRLLLLLAGITSLTAVSGCGGGWGTQQYPMTVTATAGALSHSVTVNLISK